MWLGIILEHLKCGESDGAFHWSCEEGWKGLRGNDDVSMDDKT